MDFTDIRQLIKDFNDSSISKLSLELDEVKIRLEKESCCSGEVSSHPLAPSTLATTTVELPVDDLEIDEGIAVKSPVVGIFYVAPSPGADPYVSVGQHVEKGQIVCIVEAMKMMNEIPSPVSGTVTRILVEQEDAVEYDQALMLIRASELSK